MSHNHPVIDSDLHFTINPSTREIINPSGKAKLMQYDHQSERFTFEIPRYIEGHDMLLCDLVEVHYTNSDSSDKSTGVYLINDVQTKADDETLVFSWLISGNATKYSGRLDFSIRFACTNGENVDYAWNTEIYSGISVDKAINNTASLEDIEPDIIASLRDEMEGFNNMLKTLSERVTGVLNNPNCLCIYCGNKEDSSGLEIVSADDAGYGNIPLKDPSNKTDYSVLISKINNRCECGGSIRIYLSDACYFDVRPYYANDDYLELVAPDFDCEVNGKGEMIISSASFVRIVLTKINATITYIEL